MRITLPAAALFAEHSEKFRADAVPFVGKLSGLLAHSKRKILIEGHVSPGETGPFRSTWEFSSARAVNLLRFIQRKESLAANQLAAAALAESRPLATGAGSRAPLNSRLEVVLLNQDMEF